MTVQEYVEHRNKLKRMLAMAKTLPEGAVGREGAIAQLEAQILLIKLDLNSVY